MTPQLDVYQGQIYPGWGVSSDWGAVFSWAMGLVGMVAVAAVAIKMVKAILGNPIPYEVKRRLEEKYGHWAVQTAIRVCPLDDLKCIEREAQRLYESRILRR